MAGGKNSDDFDMGSIPEGDYNFDKLFDDDKNISKKSLPNDPDHNSSRVDKEKTATVKAPAIQKKKRSAQDFEPDMDALMMTAQSSMIIEGMKYFSSKDFSPDTHQIYMEALKGVEFYIKILNRNPNNYKKLKALIDSDTECRQVEKIAFNLFKINYDDIAETDSEKIKAFELLYRLLNDAANKAAISKSMQIVKKYNNISGEIDAEKIKYRLRTGDIGFKTDINILHQHVKIALDMLKRGKTEIAAGMKGRDINFYIVNASALLSLIYKLHGNQKVSEYYDRIKNIHSKYFIIQE